MMIILEQIDCYLLLVFYIDEVFIYEVCSEFMADKSGILAEC